MSAYTIEKLCQTGMIKLPEQQYAKEAEDYIPDSLTSQESEASAIDLEIDHGPESQSTVANTVCTPAKKDPVWTLLQLDPNAVKLWPLGSFSFVDFMQAGKDVVTRIKYEVKKEPSPQQ